MLLCTSLLTPVHRASRLLQPCPLLPPAVRLAWQQRLPTLTSHETVALLAALERAQAAVAEIRQRWQRRRAQLKTSHRRARNSLHCTCVRECGSAIEETVNREEAQRLAALEKLPST